MSFTYDLTTDLGKVRLLVNDVDQANAVFTDDEINAFLALESGNVKRAAAQGIDTIADNEALVLKVITDHQLSTNGAATAAALRVRAQELRDQALIDEEAGDGSFFDLVDVAPTIVYDPDFPGSSYII